MFVPEPPLFVKLFTFLSGVLMIVVAILAAFKGGYGVAAFFGAIGFVMVAWHIHLGRKYGFIGQFKSGAY